MQEVKNQTLGMQQAFVIFFIILKMEYIGGRRIFLANTTETCTHTAQTGEKF